MSKAKKLKTLSERQQRFAEGVLKGLSDMEAYRQAGYKAGPNAHRNAFRLKANEGIRAFIAKAMAKSLADTAVSTERLELEQQRLATADTRNLYREDGTLKSPHEWDDATAAAVCSVEMDDKGRLKRVRLHPKHPAIEGGLKRRDMGKPIVPPPPAPGSTPETPLHVSLSVHERIAQLRDAFLDVAGRSSERPVASDDIREPLHPETHTNGAVH